MGDSVDWTSIVRLCRAIIRHLTGRRHELSAAGALLTCFAIVLNIGAVTRSPISDSIPQIDPDRPILHRQQTELPIRLQIQEYDPIKPVIKLSHVLMVWASIYDAPAALPVSPANLGNDDGKIHPQEPRSPDNAGTGRDTITGIWAPDDKIDQEIARRFRGKRQLDLIDAFARAGESDWKLAIVGDSDYASDYARMVARAAANTAGVVLLGYQTGDALAELYTHAGLFVLPSSHEGQPIAALEAISYRCPIILSDIPAHREIGTSSTQFVRVGNVAELARHLKARCAASAARDPGLIEHAYFMEDHDWWRIAERTLDLYLSARSQHASPAPLEGLPGRKALRLGHLPPSW